MIKHLMHMTCLAVVLTTTPVHASIQANDAGWEKFGNLTIKVAHQTGMPLMDLVALTSIESGFNTNARNHEGSSARGLGAFKSATWRAMVTKYGRQYGISSRASRTNARANLIMTSVYWQVNQGYLKSVLHRPPTSSEVYMAHLLGPGGAAKLLKASNSRVAWRAAGTNPGYNRNFFVTKHGHQRTVGEFKSYVTSLLAEHKAAYRSLTNIQMRPLHVDA